jgi:hypothetical protein
MSRLEAGTSTLGQVAPLMGGYLLLALATVYLSRTALRLPILQYNRTSAAATDLSVSECWVNHWPAAHC